MAHLIRPAQLHPHTTIPSIVSDLVRPTKSHNVTKSPLAYMLIYIK